MKKTILAILVFLFWASSAEATTWYVRKGGLDAHGCTNAQTDGDSTALLTINAALDCAVAAGGSSNTVDVHVGTYVETIDSNSRAFPYGGSWGTPFTLQAHSGEVVTIKANNNNFNLRIFGDRAFYAIVQGFIFDAATLLGTESAGQIYLGSSQNGGSYVRFQDNELINNNTQMGIGISGFTSNTEILRNKIHGGTWLDPQHTSGGDNSYPVYSSAAGILFDGNEIYDFTVFGLHLYHSGSSIVNNNIVRNNYIHDFENDPAKAGGWGILVSYGSGNQVYNNIVANAPYGGGIALWNGCVNCSAYNNTVYNAAFKGFNTEGSTNAIVRNNIDYLNGTSTLDGSGTVADHNLTTNPNFVSTNSADATFLNLSASSSAAIDQGVAAITTGITVPYNDAAPDIGAFETFSIASAEVGLVDASTIDVTFQSIGQPFLPTSAITSSAWTTTCGTVSSVTNTAATHMHVNLAAPWGGGACTVSYNATTGNVTNGQLIGNTHNQRLNAITTMSVTDHTGGGGPTLAYVSGQFYLLQGAADTNWIAKGNADQNITVAPGSKLWWRYKVANTGTTTNLNPRIYVSYDGGSYVALTNSFVNAVKALGTSTQSGTVLSQGTSITQDVLASTYGNVDCTATRDASAQPTLTMANNRESECAMAIEFDTTATANKVYNFKVYTDSGTAVGGPMAVTIGSYGASR